MKKEEAHPWVFKPRFRRHAFGWKSQPAITRVRQAVAEIKKVGKTKPILAAEGAILFFERVSPALEQVDGSSGSIGSAVSNAIWELVPLIAGAPAEAKLRDAWLERLFEAHQLDEIPYIEQLAEHWGELCGSEEAASAWADRLAGDTRTALSANRTSRSYFRGTSACLSALFRAGRFDELIELLRGDAIWPYKQWAVRAMAARGQRAEALRYAESCRSPWASDHEVDSICEEILISSGLIDEAYARYGVRVNRGGTYLASFCAVAKKYPHKAADEILADLVKTTPGEEGKWFAAAKEASLYPAALALASRSPCDLPGCGRANVIANYRFNEGGLKGFNVGGALRWRSAPTIGYGVKTSASGSTVLDLDKVYLGPTETYVDFLAGYRGKMKAFGGFNYRAQLNVRNLLNEHDPVPVGALTTGAISRLATVDSRVTQLTFAVDF